MFGWFWKIIIEPLGFGGAAAPAVADAGVVFRAKLEGVLIPAVASGCIFEARDEGVVLRAEEASP